MNGIQRSVVLIVMLLPASWLLGCSGPAKATFDPTGKHKLTEIGQMLAFVKANGDSPPAGVEDLERVEPLVPLSAGDLRAGDIEYFWGKGLSSGGNAEQTILAYEKKVPAEGGWALMQDGAVKELTPQEFNAYAKAK